MARGGRLGAKLEPSPPRASAGSGGVRGARAGGGGHGEGRGVARAALDSAPRRTLRGSHVEKRRGANAICLSGILELGLAKALGQTQHRRAGRAERRESLLGSQSGPKTQKTAAHRRKTPAAARTTCTNANGIPEIPGRRVSGAISSGPHRVSDRMSPNHATIRGTGGRIRGSAHGQGAADGSLVARRYAPTLHLDRQHAKDEGEQGPWLSWRRRSSVSPACVRLSLTCFLIRRTADDARGSLSAGTHQRRAVRRWHMMNDNALARCPSPDAEGRPGLPRETAAGRDGRARLSGRGATQPAISIDKATGTARGASLASGGAGRARRVPRSDG